VGTTGGCFLDNTDERVSNFTSYHIFLLVYSAGLKNAGC
jgi:hypothetical protein